MAITAPSARDRGIQLLREGSVADSVDFFLQALAEDPTNVDLYLLLGVAYSRMGQNDKSVDILGQAVELAPASARVHYNLGVAYHKASNLTLAKDEYARATTLDPNYVVAKSALEFVAKESPDQPGELSVDG